MCKSTDVERINNLRSVASTAMPEAGNVTKRVVIKHTAVVDANDRN